MPWQNPHLTVQSGNSNRIHRFREHAAFRRDNFELELIGHRNQRMKDEGGRTKTISSIRTSSSFFLAIASRPRPPLRSCRPCNETAPEDRRACNKRFL